MLRREFFGLISATVVEKPKGKGRNKREHHKDTVIYHGPMLIPTHVAECVRESPDLAKSTSRHLVARYNDTANGGIITYRFRTRIPKHRGLVGEIVITCDGAVRVHCWSIANIGGVYKDVNNIIAERIKCPTVGTNINDSH